MGLQSSPTPALPFFSSPSFLKVKPPSLKTNTGTMLQGTSSFQMQQRGQEGVPREQNFVFMVSQLLELVRKVIGQIRCWDLLCHGNKATSEQFFSLSLFLSSGNLGRDKHKVDDKTRKNSNYIGRLLDCWILLFFSL